MITFKRCLLVFICMIAFCGFGRFRRRFGRGEELTGDSLKQIEKYLTKRLPDDTSPKANIVALVNRSVIEQNSAILKALKELTNLPQLSNKCDRESFGRSLKLFMQTNKVYLPEDGEKKKSRLNLERLNSIVRHFVTLQAEFCLKVLPKSLEKKYDQLDEFKRKSVENAFSRYLASFGFGSPASISLKPSTLFQLFVTNSGLNLDRDSDADLINYGLMLNAKDDETSNLDNLVVYSNDQKPTLNVNLYRSVFNRNLVEPCEHYMEELYPDIFSIARFAVDQVDNWSNQIRDEDKDFYLTWSRINLCRIVLSNEELFERMVDAERRSISYLIRNKFI